MTVLTRVVQGGWVEIYFGEVEGSRRRNFGIGLGAIILGGGKAWGQGEKEDVKFCGRCEGHSSRGLSAHLGSRFVLGQ